MTQVKDTCISLKCRFHPQAWINDYAIEADPEGETDFIALWPSDRAIPEQDTYQSDNLRHDPRAPKWIQDWSGPFYIEILEEGSK